MKQRIQRKIEYLREQPEPVRYRAVSYITVASGVILVALWLTVLLPAQLYMQNRGNDQREDDKPGVFTQLKETFKKGTTELPQVGGVQDVVTGSPSPSPTPSSAPLLPLPTG